MSDIIKACLNFDATIPEDNEQLISFVIAGTNRYRWSSGSEWEGGLDCMT